MRAWEARTRKLPVASRLDRPTLVNHIPALLEAIASMADQSASGGPASLPPAVVEKHASERLDAGVDLAEVVREFSVLRGCITELLEESSCATERAFELDLLNDVLDRAITESIQRYTAARDRALSGFDRIAGVAFRSKGLDDLLQRMLEVLAETVPSIDTASIFLRDDDRLRIRAAIGVEEDLEIALSIPMGEGFTGMIAAEGKPRALERAAERPFLMSPAIRKKGVRALFGVPLVDDGEVVGVAHVGSLSAERFSQQDENLVAVMGHRVAAAIRQHLLRETAERRGRQQEAVARLGILALESTSLESLFQRAVEIVRETFGVAIVMLFELLPDRAGLLLRTGVGLKPGAVGTTVVESGHRSLAGYTVLTGEPVIVEDLRQERRFDVPPLLSEHGLVSALTVVIWPHGHEKPPYGVLEAEARERRTFTRDDISFLQAMANVLATAIERSELERERGYLVARLQETSENLETIVRGSPLAIVALDEAGRVSSWNPAAERLFGWVEAEVLERPPPLISDDDREGSEARLSELSRSAASVSLEMKGLRKDGSVVAVSVWAAPRRDSHGARIGTLVVVADVTEAKHARERLERAYRETQVAVRTRDEVLAIVSHDLRNPLGAITMSTALLTRRLSEDAFSRNKLDIIHKSATRMERLISDLVDMASIQGARLALQREVHEVGSLVSEAVLLQGPLAGERSIELTAQLELPESTPVFCDRERLLQVFSNLIGNAVKFCNPGDRVAVRATLKDGEVWFSVADTGPGIPPEQAPHIFDRFWSGAHKRGGTGLGLFIAKGIVEAHEGRIWLESRVGAGTTFTFTLPSVQG